MDFIIAFAAVAVFLCPLACILFYKKGIEDGRAAKDGKQIEPVVKKPVPKKDEERKPSVLSQYLTSNGDKK